MGYWGSQGVARGYRGLQGVSRGYRGLQGITRAYNGLIWVRKLLLGITFGYKGLQGVTRGYTSSETKGQSVGSGEKAGGTFSSTGKRAPGYRLSANYFQKFKRMPVPDWAQKMLCIIVPNRLIVSPEFFS